MLISSAVSCNIYGAKTENRFRSCLRDLENGTITYHTNDCKEPITLHCFKEKQSSLTESVEVLNVITILLNEVQMVRGRVPKFEELQKQESDADSYCVTHTVQQSNAFQITEFITSQLSKRICVSVQNRVGEELKLRKGQIIAEIQLVEENREQEVKVAGATENISYFDEKNIEGVSEYERKRLENITMESYKIDERKACLWEFS